MARRTVEGTAKAAIVGAGTPAGIHVRLALEDRGVPGRRVSLYGSTPGEAMIGEYAGEARLLQGPEPEEVASADVVFLCEGGPAARRLLEHPESGPRCLDLTGEGRGLPVAHATLRPPPPAGPIAVPHPLSIVLGELVRPLVPLGLAAVSGTILRPAADFGDAGLEELREQTLKLLRFDRPPTEVFGRQIAFNVLPQGAIASAEPALEERLARETAVLLGDPGPAARVALVAVPVFHGHGLSLRLEGLPADPDAILAALCEAEDVVLAADEPWPTPMDLPEKRRTLAGALRADGDGAWRLWAVAAEVGAAAGRQAVALAAGRVAL